MRPEAKRLCDTLDEAIAAIELRPRVDRRTQNLLDERAVKAERRRFLAEPQAITGFGNLESEPSTTNGRWK